MKIWVDDIRPAPEGYIHLKSVFDVISWIIFSEHNKRDDKIEILDLDHDAGDFRHMGGDYINILNWLEESHRDYIPIRIHSMNPVGVENMRRIIQKNGWKEI